MFSKKNYFKTLSCLFDHFILIVSFSWLFCLGVTVTIPSLFLIFSISSFISSTPLLNSSWLYYSSSFCTCSLSCSRSTRSCSLSPASKSPCLMRSKIFIFFSIWLLSSKGTFYLVKQSLYSFFSFILSFSSYTIFIFCENFLSALIG